MTTVSLVFSSGWVCNFCTFLASFILLPLSRPPGRANAVFISYNSILSALCGIVKQTLRAGAGSGEGRLDNKKKEESLPIQNYRHLEPIARRLLFSPNTMGIPSKEGSTCLALQQDNTPPVTTEITNRGRNFSRVDSFFFFLFGFNGSRTDQL